MPQHKHTYVGEEYALSQLNNFILALQYILIYLGAIFEGYLTQVTPEHL